MSARTVLIAVDASENAKIAFNYYMEEIHRATDHVIICHVPEITDLPTFSFKAGIQFPVEEWTKALNEQSVKVKQVEDAYEQLLVPKKVHYKLHSIGAKSPGQGIISVSEQEGAKLVVIGTRGLDMLRRTLLGSVSDYVVRHSKVPVLVCPANN